VFLFSGYLFAINKLFGPDVLADLLNGLRAHHIPVVTSDPALGLLSSLQSSTLHASSAAAVALRKLFSPIVDVLRTTHHLYLAPEAIDNRTPFSAFFNSAIIDSPDVQRSTGSPPSWLFVLSPEDYVLQAGQRGTQGFTEVLASRVQDAARLGRRAQIIAPKQCISDLYSRLSPQEFTAITSSSITHFLEMLAQAEHVFYWNLLSASIVARLLNRRPVHFFSWGHLARALPAIQSVAMTHFYPSCRIEWLDSNVSLTLDDLQRRAHEQQTCLFDPVLRNLSRGQSPDQVLTQLLSTRAVSPGAFHD
jgi:hypothetical protein